jgi:glycosyltransferase involved in cell wall biosynthesis
MKIAILTTQAPFIRGGAEMHAENLERELKKRGHEAEIVSLPFKGHPPQSILDQMLAARATDLSDCVPKIDLVICLKFPAWYVKHPNKVYWILHQHRDAYDLWDRGLSDLLHHDTGPVTRDAITVADTHEFKNATRLFANSQNVADRLKYYNGLQAQPLYHPPPGWEELRAGQTGNYIYYPSRIGPMKRQSLVIDALAHADPSVRIVFSGAPDNPESIWRPCISAQKSWVLTIALHGKGLSPAKT